MPQLHCYVPEPVARKLHERAEAAGQSASRYIAELIRREVGVSCSDVSFGVVIRTQICLYSFLSWNFCVAIRSESAVG